MPTVLESSILKSTKKALGLAPDYDPFDPELAMHINSSIAALTQIGVGPNDGFMIEGEDETWEDLLGDSPAKFSQVKSYIFAKVKLLFDPPQNSFGIAALEKQSEEFLWRLSIAADPVVTVDLEDDPNFPVFIDGGAP